MAKQKTHPDSRFKDDLIRKLRNENKSLKRRLARLEKRERLGFNPDTIDDDDEELVEQTKASNQIRMCPDCHKCELEQFSVADRTFDRCNLCGYRKKLK